MLSALESVWFCLCTQIRFEWRHFCLYQDRVVYYFVFVCNGYGFTLLHLIVFFLLLFPTYVNSQRVSIQYFYIYVDVIINNHAIHILYPLSFQSSRPFVVVDVNIPLHLVPNIIAMNTRWSFLRLVSFMPNAAKEL